MDCIVMGADCSCVGSPVSGGLVGAVAMVLWLLGVTNAMICIPGLEILVEF